MGSSPPSFLNFAERLRVAEEQWAYLEWQLLCNLRVAMPGVIKTFDAAKQTATVQPTIRENLNVNLQPTPIEIPVLQDVPIVMLRAGGVALTMPVTEGDECLLVFADMCIDAWWQSGGVQNQIDRRRHDLSDAFAIVGPWSKPRVLTNYSASAAQLRSEDGNTYIEVLPGQVNVAQNLTVKNGANGSFSTQDGKVVTVQDGIVTNIS